MLLVCILNSVCEGTPLTLSVSYRLGDRCRIILLSAEESAKSVFPLCVVFHHFQKLSCEGVRTTLRLGSWTCFGICVLRAEHRVEACFTLGVVSHGFTIWMI